MGEKLFINTPWDQPFDYLPNIQVDGMTEGRPDMVQAIMTDIGLHGEVMDRVVDALPQLQLHLNGDNCWPELENNFTQGELVGIARLTDSTVAGASALTFRIQLPDGTTVLAQTTLKLINMALAAVNAREVAERESQLRNRF